MQRELGSAGNKIGDTTFSLMTQANRVHLRRDWAPFISTVWRTHGLAGMSSMSTTLSRFATISFGLSNIFGWHDEEMDPKS
jgi:hypothetical protein